MGDNPKNHSKRRLFTHIATPKIATNLLTIGTCYFTYMQEQADVFNLLSELRGWTARACVANELISMLAIVGHPCIEISGTRLPLTSLFTLQ